MKPLATYSLDRLHELDRIAQGMGYSLRCRPCALAPFAIHDFGGGLRYWAADLSAIADWLSA